jgi:coenzyme F420-reducing hydrogenase delta subunit
MPQQTPVPAAPPAPEAPAPFPPHTVAQLQALEQGALAYTVLDTTTNGQRKKIVRIIYPRCVAWQQVATLLKALKEQQDSRFETFIIQGYLSSDPDVYTFTNGQLTFDRNVRLGSQTLNRYQIETGNGFESDSVRIVLSE